MQIKNMKLYYYITPILSAFLFGATSCAQSIVQEKSDQVKDTLVNDSSCGEFINREIQSVLYRSLGKDWVLKNLTKKSKVYFTLTMDSFANVISVEIHKAEKLSSSQVKLLEESLKNTRLCLVNSDPHLSFSEFITIGRNRYKYIYQYPSYYTNK